MHDGEQLVLKDIEYVPGLYKIFDEILVNAADNKVRDPKMDKLEVNIDPVSCFRLPLPHSANDMAHPSWRIHVFSQMWRSCNQLSCAFSINNRTAAAEEQSSAL